MKATMCALELGSPPAHMAIRRPRYCVAPQTSLVQLAQTSQRPEHSVMPDQEGEEGEVPTGCPDLEESELKLHISRWGA
jgi:hypothetical protein